MTSRKTAAKETNSTVKTEGNDHELIEILSSPEGSPEKKR